MKTSRKTATDSKRLAAFGDAILQARRSTGMTQAQLAKLLGVDNSTIGYWERAFFRPSEPCYEALLAWCPSLSKLPIPDTAHTRKPPGWQGRHAGAKPASVPASRAKPNRVKKADTDWSPACPVCDQPLVDDSCTNTKCPSRRPHCCMTCGTPLVNNRCPNTKCASFCPQPEQLKLPHVTDGSLPPPPPPKIDMALMQITSTAVSSLMECPGGPGQLRAFLVACQKRGMTLEQVISVITAATRHDKA